MRFEETYSRLAGLMAPVTTEVKRRPESERQVAGEILAYMGQHRALYVAAAMDAPTECEESIVEIRTHLGEQLRNVDPASPLAGSISGMRTACSKFLIAAQHRHGMTGALGRKPTPWETRIFTAAIGELRGVIGIHITRLSAQYGVDIPDSLIPILPAEAE